MRAKDDICSILFLFLLSCSPSYLSGQEQFVLDDFKLPKIAVIGAGIGGTSAAYKLSCLFGSDLPQIDIYDHDRVAGRLRTMVINSHEYETGGTIIHPANQYMSQYQKMLGLSRLAASDDGGFAMFKNQEKVFETSASSWMSTLQMFWRYGLSLFSMNSSIKSYLADFERVYKWQKEGQAFTTVPNLILSMSEELMNSTHVTLRKHLLSLGISKQLIDEMVTVATRVNYGQSVDVVNGFVGSVSVAGASPGLWSVKGGNHQVPEGLLKRSKANLIRDRVAKIYNTNNDSSSFPSFKLETASRSSTQYDAVVIAAPLITGQEGIEFLGFTESFDHLKRQYHHLKVYIVDGERNYRHFGYASADSMPADVFPIGEDEFYNQISTVHSTTGSDPLYKIFANKELTDEQLNTLFMSRRDTRIVDWYAYPEYSTEMDFVKFALVPGLYYVNPIELAASAMEMSAVGGNNAALLLYNHWMANDHLIDNMFVIEEKHIKIEL